MFFRARNGTYKRVPQKGNVYFEDSNGGGMTIYYIPSYQNTTVTAFKPVSNTNRSYTGNLYRGLVLQGIPDDYW